MQQNIFGCVEGAQSYYLAKYSVIGKPIIYLSRNDVELKHVASGLLLFEPNAEVYSLPAWDCVPYDRLSPHGDITGERISTLSKLASRDLSDKKVIILLTINSFLGIKYLFKSKSYKSIFIFLTSKVIPIFLISVAFSYYSFLQNITSLNFKENTYLFIGLILFGLSWSLINNQTNFKNVLLILIIGPYLLTSLLLGSGLLTDRSRELRKTMEYVASLDLVKNQTIKVDKSGINNNESQSKIIRIALQTPILGDGLNSFNDLKTGELSWFNESSDKSINKKSYEILFKNDTLKPWILILKR